ncbi:hypothetical protein J2X36_003081 [Methylobacterium sp. BE186]|uniref:hypothetical protein n=1 Tax=Methylobacterium sp. BE186 TaxID=2817715 RepID=UPI0028595FB0|nr:hypothetical protein [Methylobacterium sp. BE186]MDR7038322.1 hypothetical protein [Methylobacterium sp. BE186]
MGGEAAISQKLLLLQKGSHVRSYMKVNASALPSLAGINQPDGSRITNGTAGFICHGPYTSLASGEYTAGLYIRRLGSIDVGTLTMDVVSDYGNHEISKQSIPASELMTRIAGLVSIDFEIVNDAYDVEVRLWVPDRVEVQLRELVIFRRNSLDWCL